MAQYPASTGSKLLVTKSNTAGEASLGTATLTGAGSATASAWGQISASLSADMLITQATVVSGTAFGSSDEIYVEVGYGGAGSETAIAAIPVVPGAPLTGASPKFAIGTARIPPRVASGQRLAIRVTDSANTLNTATITIRLWGVPYANVEGN